MKTPGIKLLIYCCMVLTSVGAQTASAQAPVLSATAKGPNQINLTWPAVSNPAYGYKVEIQSASDTRYLTWTSLRSVPQAGGYTCDSTVLFNGGRCNISDPSGVHVYNPPPGVPYWVTDATYVDPLDGTPAQFIATSLKPNTSYSFRVKAYSGALGIEVSPNPAFPYSNVVTTSTLAYTLRYVSPAGSDSNDGAGPQNSHAWRTIAFASSRIGCGMALLVLGGQYAVDGISMTQNCSSTSRAVVMANPGDSVVITSTRLARVVDLEGSYIVVDGIISASSTSQSDSEYDAILGGHHNALLNVELHPAVIPTFFQYGLFVDGNHNLVYQCYVHDFGSPDATQNPGGNGGFIFTVWGTATTNNVFWSNHITRGGHDTSLCMVGCSYNRWLNNVMDGGWGIGWNVIGTGGSTIHSAHNLFEGNIVKDAGQLVTYYKPGIQVSYGYNTVRRNIVLNGASYDVEISALNNGDTAVNALVYNNTFYNPVACLFGSSAGGSSAYDNDLFANNICYKLRKQATQLYLGDPTFQITHNAMLFADSQDVLLPNQPIVIWNRSVLGQNFVSVATADASYGPAFSSNKGLDVDPQFVDERSSDFRLRPTSPLIHAAMSVIDPDWGSSVGVVDVGAYGIHAATAGAQTSMASTGITNAVKPTSHVSPLPAVQTQGLFSVQWSGTGVRDFTIYVSDNGGPYTGWQTNTIATQATYVGFAGHSYSFYSLSRDQVGNMESSKSAAEATTSVSASACATDVTAFFQLTPGTLQFKDGTRQYVQTVTFQRLTQAALAGPLSLVVDNLSPNVALSNKSGTTTCTVPIGSPFVKLLPGAIGFTLQFSAPDIASIKYNPRIVAGSGTR